MPKLTIDSITLIEGYSLFRTAAHKERYRILKFLDKRGEARVKDIYKSLRLMQSRTSGHLAILRKYGMVYSRRSGKEIYYSVNYKRLREVEESAARLEPLKHLPR